MLRVLWTSQRAEEGGGGGGGAWRADCLPRVSAALRGESEALRAGVCAHVLPVVLSLDPGALGPLLREAAATGGPHAVRRARSALAAASCRWAALPSAPLDPPGFPARLFSSPAFLAARRPLTAPPRNPPATLPQAAAVVALLQAGRRLKLVLDLDDLPAFCPAPTKTKTDAQLPALGAALSGPQLRAVLLLAAGHRSEALAADALALACHHPRSTAPPSDLELEIASRALALAMRSCSPALRHSALASAARMFARLRAAAGAARGPGPRACAAAGAAWMRRVGAGAAGSLYPGAAYGRKFMAVHLVLLQLQACGDLLPPPPPGAAGHVPAFFPFHADFLAPSTVAALLDAMLDPWDRIREAAGEALAALPAPLPGVEAPAAVDALLRRARALACSPRLREADSGARLMLLVFQQYVLRLGWRVAPGAAAGGAEAPPPGGDGGGGGARRAEAVLHFMHSMVDLVDAALADAAADMAAACRRSLAHGPLLALRRVRVQRRRAREPRPSRPPPLLHRPPL
jgi:hypothetical protein